MRAKWFMLAALGLLAVSCMVKEPEQDVTMMTDAPKITATFGSNGPSTKVSMTESDGTSRLTFWEKGDEIAVFYHNTRALEYALEGDGGEPTGVFNYAGGIGAGLEFQGIYGLYPYDKEAVFDGSMFTLTFPAEQNYREKAFDPKANLMVAASKTNDLFFRNVGGYLVLQLYGEDVSVKKVVVSGNCSEPLAGPAYVWVDEEEAPETEMDWEGETEVALVCAEPVKVGETADGATEFWFVLPPVKFEEGITVNVEMEGSNFSISTTQPLEVVRNQVCRMAALCVAVTEATFEAEVAWTYADDAEVDHNLFYFGTNKTPNVYSRKALPLGIDAAIAAKYGEELAGAAPVSIAVRIADVPAEGAEPAFENLADDATFSVGNLALKDGALVADVEDFEWDKVYEITYQYSLSTCELTVTGTVTTVDRSREAVEIPAYEYTFELGKYDEETGFGYTVPEDGTGAEAETGYYAWNGDPITASVFAAYKEAGIIGADDFADLDAFFEAELREKIKYGNPSGDPESVYDYVAIGLFSVIPHTNEYFSESVLKGDIFSSGVADASDPTLIVGNKVYRFITTYIGQLVEIPFVFSYYQPAEENPILFKEDFENNFVQERMSDWTFFDADGDDYNWEYYDDNEVDTRYNHYSGIGHISSASYENYYGPLTPDNWAVTPAITLSPVSNYLSFWVGVQDPDWTKEFYAVYLTTDEEPSSDPNDYVVLMAGEIVGTSEPFETYANGSKYVYRYVIKIPDDYKGATVHIAFRHFKCTDMFRFNLDDVYVTETAPVVGDQESTINPEPEPEPEPDPNAIFSCDFEDDEDFEGWMSYDVDGDGYGWEISVANGNGGSVGLISRSYYSGSALTPDNWLISPPIGLGSESYLLRFWASSSLSNYPDYYSVYVAEYPDDDAAWAALEEAIPSSDPLFSETAAASWHQVFVTIPEAFRNKTICIIFRHHNSADQLRICLDDVEVAIASGSPSPAPAHFGTAARKIVAPKPAAPGMRKEDLPELPYHPLPAWKK